ncbi:catalytic/ hydrolase [Iris pallida]|uniref:Catalytic/ hydrolase n=1 Tax=Iris pallida TaxID=29817 RepID=A0AAX6FI14_IRIPA|nr:catalytic/ hydrolase [Iris pallida]
MSDHVDLESGHRPVNIPPGVCKNASPSWLSFTALRDRCLHRSFVSAGLRPASVSLPDGTAVRCWVPRSPDPSLPSLLLLHGYGANATWQWAPYVRPLLSAGFNLYVPDLLFFGGSSTPLPDRSEAFQAASVVAAMEAVGAPPRLAGVVGVSYGGFVAYRIAAMFPGAAERVVLLCAGVCLEEGDLGAGMFILSDVEEAARVLLPRTPEKLRELVAVTHHSPPRCMPTCFIKDYINVMCSDYVVEKTDLIYALIKDRKLSDLPKITQPTLIIWGEYDRVFPLELGHRLKRHLEENSQLVVIKNAGHAVNLEKPKEVIKHLKAFLVDSSTAGHQKRKATRWWFPTKVAGQGMKRLASNLPLLSREKA